MDRRKMLNVIGLGGLVSWSGNSVHENYTHRQEYEMRYLPSLQDLLLDRSLKAGNIVTTMGYHEAGDGGDGQYRIEPAGDHPDREIGGSEMENGLIARLTNAHTVNYCLFGAKGDGKHDDGPAIKLAHQYANEHQLPVQNLSGKFRIEKTRDIPVETGVQWNQTIFYINEMHNTNQPVFHIKSQKEAVEIRVTNPVGKAVIDQLKPGVQMIPELKDFENHLIHLHDDQDRIAFRAGNYNKSGRAREELIYVSQQGRILGDVAWSFKPTAKITAYPAENIYLVVEGGTFYLSGDNPSYDRSPYTHNGILVTRSRTRICRQWVGIEPGKKDVSLTPRSGFYYFTTAYDVRLEDIRLNPREQNREGEDRDVPHGTYGIGGNRVLEFTMENVVAEGTGIHWGILGTNMMKNIHLAHCRINRFDVHFHLWNLTIRDCEIGHKGITVTGGGRLLIENTVVMQQRFINFRQDYGAKWDGDVSILRSELRPIYNGHVTLLNFRASDFDYGYPIGIARSIVIEDFAINYSAVPSNDDDCNVLNLSDYSVTNTSERLFFPEYVRMQNIRVKGRKKGIKIAHVVDCRGYQVSKPGVYDGDYFKANSLWHLENLDLQDVYPGQPDEQSHLFAIPGDNATNEYLPDSPHVHLKVVNCPAFSAILPGIRVRFQIEQSIINQLIFQDRDKMEGEIYIQDCHLIPVPTEKFESSYKLDSSLGTSLLNCVIHLPLVEKTMKESDLDLVSFIKFDEHISYNHVNTRLSNGLTRFLADHQVELSQEFNDMLKLSSNS